jgi:hypothetical protein
MAGLVTVAISPHKSSCNGSTFWLPAVGCMRVSVEIRLLNFFSLHNMVAYTWWFLCYCLVKTYLSCYSRTYDLDYFCCRGKRQNNAGK